MDETIGVINPETNKVHAIPFGELDDYMNAGGKFADETQYRKALALKDQSEGKSSIPSIRPQAQEEQSQAQEQPQQPERPEGFKGLAADTVNNLSGALKNGIGFLRDIPEEVKSSNELGNKNNPRALAALASSLASGGKAVVNTSHDLSKFLWTHLAPNAKIPYTDRSIADLIPHIPEDTGLEKLLGLDKQQKGERFIRAVPDLTAAVAIPTSLITKGIRLLHEGKALKALDKTLEAAQQEHNLSKEQTKKLGKALRKDFSKTFNAKMGQADPTTQYENARVKEGEIVRLEDLAKRPIEQLEEPPAPINEMELKKHSNQNFEQAKATLAEGLQHGKEHERHGGTIVAEEAEKVHEEGNKKYQDIRDEYKNEGIQVNNQEEVKKIKNTVSALQAEDKELPGYAHDTPELLALNHHLNALESEVIPAADVLDTYQSLEQLAAKSKDSAYGRQGLTRDQRKRAVEIADEYKSKADRLAQILEESGGTDVRKKLKEANQFWRKWAELRDENPITKNALAHGKLPPGTLTKLTGTTPGNDFLNALVGSRPDLKKWIFGQEFNKTGKFNRLLETERHENIQPYLKSFTDIQDHLNAYRDALAGKKEVSSTIAEHNALVKALGEKAAERAETMVAKEQQAKLDAQVKAHNKAEKELEHQIKIEEAKGNSVSDLKKELKSRREARDETKRKLGRIVKLGLAYTGIKHTHIVTH